MKMRIETKRLLLRNPRKKDVGDLVNGLNDLRISESLGFIPHPYTEKNAHEWIEKNASLRGKKKKEYNFVIELREEKKVVGAVLLGSVDYFHGSASVGYWVNADYWGQGIITEATREIINFAFDELNLRRLHLSAYVENEASNKIAQKLGFSLEGTLRKSHKTRATGKIHDSHTYGLLRENFKSEKMPKK